LKQLKGGVDTELGEKGINLSGGQKARVTLARTVYQNADIVLLDDPVSALDAKVGKAVFKEVVRGMCKGKTTILATHAVDFFNLADKIILVNGGKLMGAGTMKELENNSMMKEIMDEHNAQRQTVLDVAAGSKKRSGSPQGLTKSLTNRILDELDNKDKKKPGIGKTKTFNPMSRSKLEFKRIQPKREVIAPSRDTADVLGDLNNGNDFTDDTNCATGALIKKATAIMDKVDRQVTKKPEQKDADKKDEGKLIEKSEEQDEALK